MSNLFSFLDSKQLSTISIREIFSSIFTINYNHPYGQIISEQLGYTSCGWWIVHASGSRIFETDIISGASSFNEQMTVTSSALQIQIYAWNYQTLKFNSIDLNQLLKYADCLEYWPIPAAQREAARNWFLDLQNNYESPLNTLLQACKRQDWNNLQRQYLNLKLQPKMISSGSHWLLPETIVYSDWLELKQRRIGYNLLSKIVVSHLQVLLSMIVDQSIINLEVDKFMNTMNIIAELISIYSHQSSVIYMTRPNNNWSLYVSEELITLADFQIMDVWIEWVSFWQRLCDDRTGNYYDWLNFFSTLILYFDSNWINPIHKKLKTIQVNWYLTLDTDYKNFTDCQRQLWNDILTNDKDYSIWSSQQIRQWFMSVNINLDWSLMKTKSHTILVKNDLIDYDLKKLNFNSIVLPLSLLSEINYVSLQNYLRQALSEEQRNDLVEHLTTKNCDEQELLILAALQNFPLP